MFRGARVPPPALFGASPKSSACPECVFPSPFDGIADLNGNGGRGKDRLAAGGRRRLKSVRLEPFVAQARKNPYSHHPRKNLAKKPEKRRELTVGRLLHITDYDCLYGHLSKSRASSIGVSESSHCECAALPLGSNANLTAPPGESALLRAKKTFPIEKPM